MPEAKLTALILILIALVVAHDAEHFVRGDILGPPRLALAAAFLFVLTVALLLYARGKIGPLWLALSGRAGAAFLWLAHLSPYSKQTPQTIFAAY
jgi:hypothetical protein